MRRLTKEEFSEVELVMLTKLRMTGVVLHALKNEFQEMAGQTANPRVSSHSRALMKEFDTLEDQVADADAAILEYGGGEIT